MKAGLIGHPVAHSKSPFIHNYWMEQNNIQGSYELFDVEKQGLSDLVQRLIDENYDGFNITVPHKENIMPFCDVIDESAQQVGAVNTVQIKDGKLHGFNTDVFGFVENLKQSVSQFDLKEKTALVLGAGGAARAVIQGLKNEGLKKIFLTNRTFEKAEKLKEDFGDIVECVAWEEREKNNNQINLLVNTTLLGMVGKPVLEFDLNGCNADTVIYDIVYNPLHTDLLKNAENSGFQVVTGIGMLLYQAVPAFALWSGVKPTVTKDLQDLVLS